MLVAQICFNYHVGFLIDKYTGRYRALRGAYEPPDFGSDEVPTPDVVVIEDPFPHPDIIEDDE